MLFQEPTPDTSGYLIAGYTIAFLVMALYVASIYVRSRNLQRDKDTLEDMEKPAPPVQKARNTEAKRNTIQSGNNGSGKPVTKRSIKK